MHAEWNEDKMLTIDFVIPRQIAEHADVRLAQMVTTRAARGQMQTFVAGNVAVAILRVAARGVLVAALLGEHAWAG